MQKLVFIDACIRKDQSRTLRIALPIMEELSKRYEITSFHLPDMDLPTVGPELHQCRTSGNAPDWAVKASRVIAEADRIVIAAPFWDMSFPAALKTFIEHVSLFNITFADNGQTCYGLCKCQKVLYITTRGMNIPTGDPREQGTPYLRALSTLWGLGNLETIALWNIDYSTENEIEQKISQAISEGLLLARTF